MKIITVLGARPQFVKAAAVSRALSKRAGMSEKIIHTGQHYDANMSDVFFREMEIPVPGWHLAITDTSHAAMTGRMMAKIEEILLSERPDCVIVYGDTNTTLAAALAAKKIQIKVAHVEAGLRSHNMMMPEEINRIITDRISDFLFCPTKNAMANLEKEGMSHPDVNLSITGDVMYDAFLYYSQKAQRPSYPLPEKFALATIHRAGNTDDVNKLRTIIERLNDLHPALPVVFPAHPRTLQKLEEYGLEAEFIVCEPASYFEMLYLLKHCSVVITDSGGLQKEAYFSGKHSVIMREDTEWVELVEGKYNFLQNEMQPFHVKVMELSNAESFTPSNIYGNGAAAETIADILVRGLS